MSRYILFLNNLKGKGRPLSWGPHCEIILWEEQLGCHKIRDEKVSPFAFVKFKIIQPLLCFFDPPTNKHCRKWSSMIILLSPKQRSSNYLETSKENVLRNMILSHWPCFTWKFFMIRFHRTLKFLFQTQLLCPRNICTEHRRKLPYLTAFFEIFLYLKNNDSAEHV